ncbi:MAG: hypothetical protein IJ615_02990 [Bacteroidaceae bacterium]|nr:hypothetical protein [Bacteroidaceae bacterium]
MRKVIIMLIACFAFAHASAQEKSDGGLLVGTNLNQRATARTAAVLKAGTDGLGFYPVTTTTTIKANTAYVSENKQLLIDLATLDNPVTGVQAAEMVNGKLSNGKCYDLNGREMAKGTREVLGSSKKLFRGIYVTNKKKFAVKP